MPALTITAINTNDQLTITGHGLSTGDGPAALRQTAPGTWPTSSPQLAPVTDYWIIRVDNNTIKLATSSALAMTGTAIDITGTGTATLALEYGIPYRRARTYVPSSVSIAGSQLKSVDLNEMQDALKAMHALLTAQAQSTWTPLVMPHSDRTLVIPASSFASDAATTLNTGGYRTLGAAGKLIASIPLPAGKRIRSVTVYYDPQGGSVTPRLRRLTLATAALNYIWQGAADATGTAIETQTGTALNYTMLASESYEFEMEFSGAAAHRLYYAVVVYDEPAA